MRGWSAILHYNLMSQDCQRTGVVHHWVPNSSIFRGYGRGTRPLPTQIEPNKTLDHTGNCFELFALPTVLVSSDAGDGLSPRWWQHHILRCLTTPPILSGDSPDFSLLVRQANRPSMYRWTAKTSATSLWSLQWPIFKDPMICRRSPFQREHQLQ